MFVITIFIHILLGVHETSIGVIQVISFMRVFPKNACRRWMFADIANYANGRILYECEANLNEARIKIEIESLKVFE